ncbi:hypothetical protein C9374_001816 [Naegleria lovaniensis]|uniref:Protein kinase domain-containing protein n=1 Tax=Naegleria lovaniensis TaxID=51637 RepID=A0AA88GXI0_NAELO|nr:uncharacterized protein C9374_001816 [Naegleria lovaniensis]KAG2387484.1 hypothetical protein C9374_001816 [Naegleria lovaniensis]
MSTSQHTNILCLSLLFVVTFCLVSARSSPLFSKLTITTTSDTHHDTDVTSSSRLPTLRTSRPKDSISSTDILATSAAVNTNGIIPTYLRISTIAGYDATANGLSATESQLLTPVGISCATAPSSSRENCVMVDQGLSLIRKIQVVENSSSGVQQRVMNTLVGVLGTQSYNGEGLDGPNTFLNNPSGVFVTPWGDVYFTETQSNVVRRWSSSYGKVYAVAGRVYNGKTMFYGDGGPALLAALASPRGVFVSPHTLEIYIADTFNNRIRKVFTNGTIVSIAGSGGNGPFDDHTQPFDQMLAIDSKLYFPTHVETRKNHLGEEEVYIADSNNACIRKILSNGTLVTIVGVLGQKGFNGDGIPATTALLNNPSDFSFTSTGEMIINDSDNGRVRKVSKDGIISTIAIASVSGFEKCKFSDEEAIAKNATNFFGSISFVHVAPNDDILVSDVKCKRIRRISGVTGKASAYAGTGTYGYNGDNIAATRAVLSAPTKMAILPTTGELIFTDSSFERVRKITKDGLIQTIVGSGLNGKATDGTNALQAPLAHPKGLVVNTTGELIVTDTNNHSIRKITSSGTILRIVGLDTEGYNYDYVNPLLAVDAQISTPRGLSISPQGELYFTASNYIAKITVDGYFKMVAGTSFAGYEGDFSSIDYARFNQPNNIFISKQNEIFVADSLNHVIRMIAPNGTTYTICGTGTAGYNGENISPPRRAQLNYPTGIYLSEQNELFIADTNNHRIRKVSRDGVVTTVAGNGVQGGTDIGDESIRNAKDFKLNNPTGILVVNNTLFIADKGSNRIRIVENACEEGYVMNIEQSTCTPTCFGIVASDPSVCSGNGVCKGVNVCECKAAYSGDKCDQTFLVYFIPISISLLVLCVITSLVVMTIAWCNFKRWKRMKFKESELEQKLLDLNEYSSGIEKTSFIPFDELEIISRVGSGAFGNVFKAKWKQAIVAVKSIDVSSEDIEEDDFAKEAMLLSTLKHPNIVSFFGISLSETKRLLVVEYLDGGSLEALISELRTGKRKCTVLQKIKYLIDIANGILYLHTLSPNAIIHRDLKPANILLSSSGVCKVCDFGQSRMFSKETKNAMTSHIGTFFYMANEMLSADNNIDSRFATAIDVYSFSIVMWELLFEEPPYLSRNFEKLFFEENFESSIYSKLTSYNILIEVVKGLRPPIPFSTQESCLRWCEIFLQQQHSLSVVNLSNVVWKLTTLIQQCWSSNPQERPSFSDIVNTLSQLKHELEP